MAYSSLIFTDSGGIQEETAILGIPCVTLRENTERPFTVADGTNVIAGTKKDGIIGAARLQLERLQGKGLGRTSLKKPELWDCKAAERIADVPARIGQEAVRG